MADGRSLQESTDSYHIAMEGREDIRAAIGVIALLLIVKVILGIALLFSFPIGETASLYAVLHLSVLFGVVPLAIIFGASALFWWRILRLRSRRRYLQWLEWNVETEEKPGATI